MEFRRFLRFTFFWVLPFSQTVQAGKCVDWFKKSKLNPGPNCVTECSILDTGMGTFGCTSECENLCSAKTSTPLPERVLSNLLQLYPSLTKAERDFAAKNPQKAIRGYYLSHQAERICSRQFTSSATNDESDACRHFIWAGIMRNEFDLLTAQTILEAHEAEDLQRAEEKSMDLANNRAGLLAAEELLKNKKFSEERLFDEFLKKLNSGNLVVIKKEAPKGGLE